MSISRTAGQARQEEKSLWLILVDLIFGIGFIVAGVVVGNQSHQVIYQPVTSGQIAHYIIGNGTDYMQIAGSPNLYIINDNDLSPHFDPTTLGDTVSFLYQPDTTTKIDVSDVAGNRLAGRAYTVLQITTSGSSGATYDTSKYTQNPNGYYSNHWWVGGGLIALGALIAIIALFSPMRSLYILLGTVGGTLVGGVGVPLAGLYFLGFEFPTPFSLRVFLEINPWVEPVAIGCAILGFIVGFIAAFVMDK